MSSYVINVVINKDNVIFINKAVVSKTNTEKDVERCSKRAEHEFDKLAREYLPSWSNLTIEEKTNLLDDGYYEEGEYAICLSHADIVSV
jgi:maltose-binding protein MalE